MTTSSLPLDDETAGAVVDAMVPLVGIPMAPEWRETVIASVKATAAAARLVLDFPLDDTVEPAPVFQASGPLA
ncbi:DUF4089 domain-containing protein [Methylobacterium frigidaeris]|uniref:DUF4089 domain-containing protein n=1 Tax=Methylobacterium frigidaeris TaxID=2038277 RepID=A0AA37M8B1_9HYPH|nr:DUF4089 domain-containing protein [Methylobacterium frigidaeris]PIK69332.1 hypothetical protein CS379_30370 [Methylobacterium frigidaeris]GJD65666.1 hypothetical protein MPEAHAMD_5861 [Methylobacterium frigidaeris]